ncbi:1533_t:CDS:2 [Cetraspora pellucida]|uniref:1533_t:CDS:1 n=1 Tax=Cetraspora pellucida TaxID=1433469 RepID=A0A9N9NXF4_9GLOM|nr:1533_t:CDS:2 [Cetraspora pellucida]
MTGDKYEFFLLELLRKNQIEVNSTRTEFTIDDVFRPIGDGNIDLFGNYKSLNFIIQAKFKGEKYHVGPGDIREFARTMSKQPDGTVGFFVTNVKYSDNAINTAENAKVKIVLYKDNDLVSKIKLAESQLELSKLKQISSYIEEFSIDDLEFTASELEPVVFFGIKFTNSTRIGSLKIKNAKNVFKPYTK